MEGQHLIGRTLEIGGFKAEIVDVTKGNLRGNYQLIALVEMAAPGGEPVVRQIPASKAEEMLDPESGESFRDEGDQEDPQGQDEGDGDGSGDQDPGDGGDQGEDGVEVEKHADATIRTIRRDQDEGEFTPRTDL